jgi:PAS domain S-box-containing protein
MLGVLDMQAREAGTFRDDNLPVFEAMANQLASALRSAQAYEETRIAVERADEINRRLTGEAWAGYLGRLAKERRVGYRYDLQDVEPITESLVGQGSGGNSHRRVRQPVLLRDEPIGMIQIVDEEDREWSADDMMLIEVVADRVALALEQFRAFDETQNALSETAIQAQRLALLNELAAEISSAETLADVYRIVAARTNEVLGSDRASMAMLTPSETQFEIYDLDGERGAIPSGTTLLRVGTWTGEVLNKRRAVALPEMADMPYPETRMLVQQGLHSSLNAPLFARGRAIGTLNVSRREANAYGRRDEDLLTQIASLLSAQIENRDLLEQAQKRASEMQTVAEVGAEATSALDPDQLLWMVADLVKERFGLYHAHIYLFDEADQSLVLAGAGEVGQRMVTLKRRIPMDHEHSLVARIARTREGLIVNDVTQAPDFLPNPMLPHTRAELGIPMVVGNQLLGVLDVQSDQIGRFTEEDLHIQGTLAAQIAAAMQNARLFAEAQERLAIIESSDDLIAMSDMEANLVFINPAGAQLLGYESVEEFYSFAKAIGDIHPPEGLELVQRVGIPLVLESGGFWRSENVILHKDGAFIPVEQAMFALYDDEGQPRNLATIMTDIRERKAAQEELDSERRTLQTLLANLPVGVFMADAATGAGLLTNDAALAMLGRGLDPASATDQFAEIYEAYKVVNELYPVDQMPLVRGMAGESARIDDMEIRRPDGKQVFLEVSGAPIIDASGNVTASVAVFSDITERRRAEEERQQFLIETQVRYEAGRQLVAATTYEDILHVVSRYSFGEGAVLANLLTIDLSEDGKPEWAQVVAGANAHEGVRSGLQVGTRFYLADFPFSQLWITDPERPQLVGDAETDDRLDDVMRGRLRQAEQRAIVTIPLALAGQWIGLALFTWDQPHEFTDSEERFYAAMSGQMASVLQSLRLLEETRKRATEMQAVAGRAEASTSFDPAAQDGFELTSGLAVSRRCTCWTSGTRRCFRPDPARQGS